MFQFMLSRLVLDTPNNPLDYLIDLTREINRLNKARQEVQQLEEGKKKCEEEAARRKSQVDQVSVKLPNEPLETTGTEGEAEGPENVSATEVTEHTGTHGIHLPTGN